MKKALILVGLSILLVTVACKKKDSPAAPVAPPPADTATFTITPTVTSSHTVTSTPTMTSTPTVTPTITPNSTQTAVPTVCSVLGRNVEDAMGFDVSGVTCAILNKYSVATPVTVQALGINNPLYPFDTDSDCQLGIYADSGGEPGALLVASAHFVPPYGITTRAVAPTVLPAGDYWIAIVVYPGAGTDINFVATDGVCTLSYPMSPSITGRIFTWVPVVMELPSSFGAMTNFTYALDIFAYYCP